LLLPLSFTIFFFNDPPTPEIYPLSLHEALPICTGACAAVVAGIRERLLEESVQVDTRGGRLTIRWGGVENDPNCAVWIILHAPRSEEHTSELQSRGHLVCRLLLEKKKKKINNT